MAIQIYDKVFYAHKISYLDTVQDVREMALNEANCFFINHDSFDIINIVEDWAKDESSLELVVYYKDYV